MNIFCCPPGMVEQPDPNAGWKYFTGAVNIPIIVDRETYIRPGRIGPDGGYGGGVGFWGYGNCAVTRPNHSEWTFMAYDWHTLPEPNYEEIGVLHLYSDDVYPVLYHFTLTLHTRGWATLAGVANDLWLFGSWIRPVQPFILPRGIAQMKIGENPR